MAASQAREALGFLGNFHAYLFLPDELLPGLNDFQDYRVSSSHEMLSVRYNVLRREVLQELRLKFDVAKGAISRRSAALCSGRLRSSVSGLRDYLHNAGVEITLSILGFVSGVLVARGLGPAGRGQLAAAMLWPNYIALLASFGLQHAFAYAVGVGWASARSLKLLAFKYTLVIGIPGMAVYWYLCPQILGHQFPGEIWIPRIFALGIPLILYVGVLMSIFQGSGDFLRWNIARLFRNGGWALGIVILMFSTRLSVLSLLMTQIAILATLSAFLTLRIRGSGTPSEATALQPVSRIFRYGFAIYLSSLAYNVNQSLDQLLLSVWVGPADLGQYATAVSLSSPLTLIPTMVSPIVFSRVARASGHPLEQRRHSKQALALTSALLLPAGICLTALAPWITVFLFGPTFGPAARALRVLAPASILLGLGYPLADVLRSSGRPMQSAYAAGAGAVLTIPGLFWALPRYGIMGAAWVSLVAYATMFAIQAFFLARWYQRSE